jgi:cyclophilin family peptidyl-prolyl cis-trans isomerase/HEAT repeat protein
MKRWVFCIMIISLFTSACNKGQSQLERILRLEDRRAACDSLQPFLLHVETNVRVHAVEALGKLQDEKCLNDLLKMLNDADPGVRLEAVFALGQLGKSEAEAPLITRLSSLQEELDVKVRIVEALGKIGHEQSFPVLQRLLTDPQARLRREAALSIGRMAWRQITHESLTSGVTLLLTDIDAEVRWKAGYALMRIGKGLNVGRLRKAIQDKDARVRMYAIQALGGLNDLASLESFGKLLRTEPDWRVKVKIANALGNYPLRLSANYLDFSNHSDASGHVRIALIRAIGSSALKEPERYQQNSREHNLAKRFLEEVLIPPEDEEDAGPQKEKAPPKWTPPEIGAALISYAQLLGESAVNIILNFTNYPHDRVRARAMEALGETRSPTVVKVFETHYSKAPAMVKIAILEAFAKIPNYPTPQLFVNALQEKDAVLVALAAQGISQDTLKGSFYLQPIIDAYQNLPQPVDAEAAKMIFAALQKIGDARAVPFLEEALKTPDKVISQTAAETLTKLTGTDYSSQIVSQTRPHAEFRYSEIATLGGARAFIKTNRGNIEIQLFADSAPLTVWNFVQLAEKGFFDRLTFHRVVPNFVIQGGDPRGDSWGSPGYAIRSEFNQRHFLRGTVGMASAGKDTEGCQFFITHSEQPHLDGRYTIFGQVTSGMDVVDTIQEGDVMELVAIKR